MLIPYFNVVGEVGSEKITGVLEVICSTTFDIRIKLLHFIK